jgi:hypothetical protein
MLSLVGGLGSRYCDGQGRAGGGRVMWLSTKLLSVEYGDNIMAVVVECCSQPRSEERHTK